MLDKDNKSRGMATVTYENQVQAANAICKTILLSNNVCVQNPTFGREDIWAQRHLGARHLGAKCVLAHFQQSFSTSKKNFLQKFYIFNGVSVLIFCNFLITTSNKRTN